MIQSLMKGNVTAMLLIFPWSAANMCMLCVYAFYMIKRKSIINYFDASSEMWNMRVKIDDEKYADKVSNPGLHTLQSHAV
jgi:hypothetical protein